MPYKHHEWGTPQNNWDEDRAPAQEGHSVDKIDSKNNKVLWRSPRGESVRPKTLNQIRMCDSIDDNSFTIIYGSSGTGKTFCAVAKALQLCRGNDSYKKLVLTRPVIEAGENLGFLPGSLEEKIEPYLIPLVELIERFALAEGESLKAFSQDEQPKVYQNAPAGKGGVPFKKGAGRGLRARKERGDWKSGWDSTHHFDVDELVDICPIAYLRGRTFDNTILICDEAQNLTSKQMKMLMSRIGKNSKMIICGDTRQIDIDERASGLAFISHHMGHVGDIGLLEFTKDDIQRNGIIREILEIFEDHDI